jgi:hypothetical protein
MSCSLPGGAGDSSDAEFWWKDTNPQKFLAMQHHVTQVDPDSDFHLMGGAIDRSRTKSRRSGHFDRRTGA